MGRAQTRRGGSSVVGHPRSRKPFSEDSRINPDYLPITLHYWSTSR